MRPTSFKAVSLCSCLKSPVVSFRSHERDFPKPIQVDGELWLRFSNKSRGFEVTMEISEESPGGYKA